MPNYANFDGVKINLYHNDHLPPHFHAVYAEYNEAIVIATLETLRGSLPKKKRAVAVKWAQDKKEWLSETFYALNPQHKDE